MSDYVAPGTADGDGPSERADVAARPAQPPPPSAAPAAGTAARAGDHAAPAVDPAPAAAAESVPEAAAEPAPPTAGSVPPEGAHAFGEVPEPAESASCLRTLVETAATQRTLEEVVDLVTLLRTSGQVPDAANEALRAAAVSRPIEDVVSLAAMLDTAGPQHGPRPEPTAHIEPQAEPAPARRPRPARTVLRAPREPAPGPVEKSPRGGASSRAPGQRLRWLVAAPLAVCAVLYLPRDPSQLSAHADAGTWLPAGVSAVCVLLGVLVTVRDRTWVWSAAITTGIALLSLPPLAGARGLDLMGAAVGARLPWATGLASLTGGLVAALSIMALLYRSERPDPEPEEPDQPVLVPAAVAAVAIPLDAVPDLPVGLAPDLSAEAQAPTP
ncbi:hypothetical protein [Streptomyces subrutilus]|uniref:hypothetical protein n=1 Tax=Streptomyces subrutilus TaxID=36818 RepID=UPI003407ABEB